MSACSFCANKSTTTTVPCTDNNKCERRERESEGSGEVGGKGRQAGRQCARCERLWRGFLGLPGPVADTLYKTETRHDHFL